MMVIERAAGEAVHIGGCTLRVLAVYGDEVVLALHDPNQDNAAQDDTDHLFDGDATQSR
jgi:hypothetical protein